jgi:hypothetical protein
VPISTYRLREALAWLRLDADGEEKSDDTLVFSNEASEPLRLFHRTSQTIVLRAYGHTPTWSPRLNYQGLSDESQATFRRINLRWHDLRHEYASRLVEHGVPLAQVRDLLGHASITTTERYDNQTLANLKIAAAKLERGHAFAHAGHATASAKATAVGHGVSEERDSSLTWPKFQDSFKIEPSDAGPHAPREVPAIEANELADLNLESSLGREWIRRLLAPSAAGARRRMPESCVPAESRHEWRDWLGRRDSNPDNRVQSAVSYR